VPEYVYVKYCFVQVQQQILNLFAAFMTSGPKSAKALQRSKVVMDFLRELVNSKDDTIQAEKMDKRNEVSVACEKYSDVIEWKKRKYVCICRMMICITSSW
jgi:hypothetical protein